MLHIRALQEKELSLLFKHAHDAQLEVEELHLSCQFSIHPQDFFIAHLDTLTVGFIIALRQSDEFGFISTLLVLPEFRKKGYAKELLSHALMHLEERQVALDSVLEDSSIYEKVGFKSYFDMHTYLYINKQSHSSASRREFLNYDAQSHQNINNPYLKCLMKHQGVHYKEIKTLQLIAPYGICFAHKDGYKVVIDSNNYEDALALFLELTKEITEGKSIYIEATKLNPIFLNLAQELNMIECARYARMYNKVL